MWLSVYFFILLLICCEMYAIYLLIKSRPTRFYYRGKYMTCNEIITKVSEMSYAFSPDSILTSSIDIHPYITLHNGVTLRSIPVSWLNNQSDFNIAVGDTISLTAIPNSELPLLKVKAPSPNTRVDIRLTHCPICGEPLHYDSTHNVTRCLNCSCAGQLYTKLITFLAALGLSMQGTNYKIIQSLFANASINSLADIFMLHNENIVTDSVSLVDANAFIQYIHSVRGHTNVKQFLCGLNIPNMQYTTIDQIQSLFNNNGWSILDMCSLLNENTLSMYPDIDWSAWRDFISLPGNQRLIYILATVLYI